MAISTFAGLTPAQKKAWAVFHIRLAQRNSFLSRFLPSDTALSEIKERELVNAVTYGHSHPHIFDTTEKTKMSVEHVLNRIREFPLHEIEIVKNEIIAGTNTRVIALYHSGFCPSVEDVWMYTMTVGTNDDVIVCGLIRDIEDSTAQAAESLAAEAVTDPVASGAAD